MPTVIPVKFKYAAHDLWFDPGQTGAEEGDHVICVTERGTEIGLCTMDAKEVSEERLRATIGEAGKLRPVDRIARDEDLNRAAKLAEKGEAAFPTFRKLAHESGLDMKPVGVEYLFGGGKVVCYFSAEDRVDFRQLVRDLNRELHERVDMRQIGVREEAAIAGGYAHCGQELCCARFGHQFEPVSIRMAKEQDLPLNASKISGACGRLMCCLRYEFDAYRDFKQRAPKRNAVIDTPLGKAKIIEYDTPKEQICLRLENGKQIRVPLSGMVASEAACKKSEELGCPCRPDTVTREALDRLQSPDVQMALAEVDRANGVTPPDMIDTSDIFVDTAKLRRRRGRGKQAEATDAAAPGREARPTQPAQRKRGKAERADGDQPQKTGPTGGGMRPRRRKKVEGDAAAAASDQTAPQQTRRRRHHSAADAGSAADASKQQSARSQRAAQRPAPKKVAGEGQVAEGAPRRRRRPGDHGGQRAGAAPAPQQEARRAPQQEGEKAKRRRHRGGRGRGKANGGDGSQAPSGA